MQRVLLLLTPGAVCDSRGQGESQPCNLLRNITVMELGSDVKFAII